MRTGRAPLVRSLMREARGDAAADIARLLGQLGYPADVDAVVGRLGRLGDDRLVVAELDGRIVGFAQLHVSPSIEYDAPAGKLAALVVDQEARGAGIGRALVEAIEAEARVRGCVLLFVTTAERRSDAHAFYERVGLEYTGRRYAKRLTGPGASSR